MKRCVLIDFDDGFFKYFQWKLKWYSRSFLHLELLEIGGSKRNWWIEEKWWWQACALRIRARASQRGEKNWRKLGNVSGLFSAMLCSCNVVISFHDIYHFFSTCKICSSNIWLFPLFFSSSNVSLRRLHLCIYGGCVITLHLFAKYTLSNVKHLLSLFRCDTQRIKNPPGCRRTSARWAGQWKWGQGWGMFHLSCLSNSENINHENVHLM